MKCGENVGKGLTKSPSQIPERAIKVIRLGFEPKTHSLEGCCSIQLCYRTDPYLLLTCSRTDVKSGHKDSDYFWICNKMFWFGLFLFLEWSSCLVSKAQKCFFLCFREEVGILVPSLFSD